MTDYTALAETALNTEGAETYFGVAVIEALDNGDIGTSDLIAILATRIEAAGVEIGDDEAWVCPDHIPAACRDQFLGAVA